RTKLGEKMVGSVRTSLADADVVLMLFEPEGAFQKEEEELIASLKKARAPALGVINKADLLDSFSKLEERVKKIEDTAAFQKVYAVSAQTGEGCLLLLNALGDFARPDPHYFEDDAYTDQPEKTLVAEIVREKLLLCLREEIPHGTLVEVERFHEREETPIVDIDIVIYCEKKSHKGMIIGKGGQMLKKVASEARADIEQMLGTKVNLQCWVKVRSDWRDDDRFLRQF
ncbi:GTPase Era, partial [Ruminococcaceae bacterium OttesenSCG-928-I18]|nr:GTPase Era [Ruminococcaceae bacterium OttesenSCG-928-I18]